MRYRIADVVIPGTSRRQLAVKAASQDWGWSPDAILGHRESDDASLATLTARVVPRCARLGSGATIQLTVPCVAEERWIGGWQRELRRGASQGWDRMAMDGQSE